MCQCQHSLAVLTNMDKKDQAGHCAVQHVENSEQLKRHWKADLYAKAAGNVGTLKK